MNDHVKRLLLALVGFTTALGSSLVTMDSSITLAQMFNLVPASAWMLAVAAGAAGALDIKSLGGGR